MVFPRLANADRDTFWAHHHTTRFAELSTRPGALAVLPVCGFADHGLGLALDVEETVGLAVLARACAGTGKFAPCVLPPFRFGPAPYPSSFFGIDADHGLDALIELAHGVRQAGFDRLVLFSTSPWHKEWLDAAALDLRIETGLRIYRLHLGALGLDLHPASANRASVQALAAGLLGQAPGPARPVESRDPDFRPGCWLQPPPVTPDHGIDTDVLLVTAAGRCAHLLEEAAWHYGGTPISGSAGRRDAADHAATWRPFGKRYLPALTREELEALPGKERAIVILPTAAIEQHGPHLPTGVDAFIGQGLLARALDLLPADAPVYVAPPLTYGRSAEHAAFPGTLSLGSRTFRAMLKAQAAQVKRLGFGTLAVFNSHGGNSATLDHTLREIQTTDGLRAGMLVHGFKPAELDPQEAAHGFHAGEWETSLMLALAADLVRMDLAIAAWPARLEDPRELRPEKAAITFAWSTDEIAPEGVMGDATRASAEKGARWLAAASEALAGRITALLG